MPEKIRELAFGLSTFVLAGVVWEVVALSGIYPAALFPGLGQIAHAFVSLLFSGVLFWSALGTLGRLVTGFVMGGSLGVVIGMVMGRYRLVEDFLLPVVSICYPIPALAYAPLFVLWFGLGNTPSVLIVTVATALQVIINTWQGVTAIKPIWLRSAKVMGAKERMIFRSVVLPGSLPYILTGLRIGLGAAWRVLVGVEMITAVANGLGSLIFGAKQFLETDVMLSGIIVIGLIGFVLERYLFTEVERSTLMKWGMLKT
jgi:NitT/TauT family transport system permease protein